MTSSPPDAGVVRNLPPAAPGRPRPSISCCMMVKNEEKRLPVALKSIRPWVDEIIVVDTGSTDRTMEIAREFGARVYEHPWEYNFSVHRNQSISYATGDWLLILDADEELDQETAPLLHSLVHAPEDVFGFLFKLYNAVKAGGETFILHPRMFRNNRRFHYEGLVHNRPVVYGNVARCDVKLWHYGYDEDAETMEAKHERRISMIRKWVEQEPDNFLAHSYLAHTYLGKNESLPLAVDEAFTALALLRREKNQDQRFPHVYYPLLNGLALLGRDEELFSHAADCLAITPSYPDPLLFVVGAHYKCQRWDEVCAKAAQFMDLQDACRANPENFIFFENMSYDQVNFVLYRWCVAAAQAGRDEESLAAFGRMFEHRDAQEATRRVVLTLLSLGWNQLAQRLVQEAQQREPAWDWPGQLKETVAQQNQKARGEEAKQRAQEASQAQDLEGALRLFGQAVQDSPLDPEALLGLGQTLEALGRPGEALPWLMQGLNLHPGHPQAWRGLGEHCFSQGDYAGAAALYGRYLELAPDDPAITPRLAVCQRRLERQPAPTVRQKPPRLVVFLVGGLSLEMIRQPAPHFLMGRAWGELVSPTPGQPLPDAPSWASLYTGVGPGVHGLASEGSFGEPPSLASLKVPSLWELLPPELSLGLMAIPLGTPAPRLPGWALAGRGGGPLTPQAAQPPELAYRALAAGYHSDLALSAFEMQTAGETLENDVRHEALAYRLERLKLATALELPAVDVLAVGFTALEYMQQALGLAHYRTFAAYQQLYAWIEDLLAYLRPQGFALLGQRGYNSKGRQPENGGFYCLSWLRGENGQASPGDIAPAILSHLGGDPARLGRPRGQG